MKTYTFPYGGTIGKLESWDSEIDVELTDEEAARLEASAHKESRWHLDEDEEISDICEKVESLIFEENKRMMIEDGRIEEVREFEEDEDLSDDEIVEMEMGSWHAFYPEELQELEVEEDDKE